MMPYDAIVQLKLLFVHLNLKRLENAWVHSQHCGYWCPGAKAPGHQYPQYRLNIQFIGPVSYENITLLLDNVRK